MNVILKYKRLISLNFISISIAFRFQAVETNRNPRAVINHFSCRMICMYYITAHQNY
jgi:hypothetical protein